MLGLWSSQRRGGSSKINLNAVTTSVPVVDDADVRDVPAEPTLDQNQINGDGTSTPTPAPTPTAPTKRKVRPTRTEESTKRPKLSTPRSSSPSNSAPKAHIPPTTRLSDLGGVDACVEKMLELVAMPLCHPEIYLHTGVQPPRGVLLHGPPGCGKTLLANAMAGVGFFLSSLGLCGRCICAYVFWV
jgi:ribosome biogenesis ATPase